MGFEESGRVPQRRSSRIATVECRLTGSNQADSIPPGDYLAGVL